MAEALVQVAPQVYLYPTDDTPDRVQPNVGVLVAGGKTVLIDAGNSPRHARRVALALDAIQANPPTYVIYTHSHWDHVFGGQAYGAPAIAHEQCRRTLMEMASRPWSNLYIQEEIQRNPARESTLRAMQKAVEEWRHFRILVPEITLSKRMHVFLDGLTLDIEHVGGAHAADSVVVRVPEARVIFVSDCYYPPPMHLRKPEDTLDKAMIDSLVDDAYDVYIDGHGKPRTRDEFAALAEDERMKMNGSR
jgi:glyoxylase-like metal-dependent hydrolase (beta-lactamase superfamily II)